MSVSGSFTSDLLARHQSARTSTKNAAFAFKASDAAAGRFIGYRGRSTRPGRVESTDCDWTPAIAAGAYVVKRLASAAQGPPDARRAHP